MKDGLISIGSTPNLLGKKANQLRGPGFISVLPVVFTHIEQHKEALREGGTLHGFTSRALRQERRGPN
eukprot:1325547-Amphidinium_carterae.1